MAKKKTIEPVKLNPIELVYGCFEQREVDNQRVHSIAHHPSGLCAINEKGDFTGKCRRAMFYDMTQTPEGTLLKDKIDADGLMKMHIGNMLHDEMNRAINEQLTRVYREKAKLRLSGKGYGHELPFKWEVEGLSLPFSGRMDKRIAINGYNIGMEWKSTWGMGVNDIKNNGPKEDALLQVLLYLEQPIYPVQEYLLGYVARDSCYIYSFRVYKKDGKILIDWLNGGTATTVCLWSFDDIKRALVTVEENYANHDLPNRDYQASPNADKTALNTKSHWRCRYCSYRTVCWDLKEF